MFKCLLVFVVLMLVCPVFAAIDSASAINGVNTVGKLAEIIANLTGNQSAAQLITLVVAAVGPILAFVFGHSHGVKNATKLMSNGGK